MGQPRRKTCKTCKKEKGLEEFQPWGEKGYRKYCKVCWAARPDSFVVQPNYEVGEDGERLDLLEKAIFDMRAQGRPDGQLMEHCLKVWKHGKFPDGAKVESESTRSNALKLLMGGIGQEYGVTEYKVNFVLDAKLTCSRCGQAMDSDPRVSSDQVHEMFGAEE